MDEIQTSENMTPPGYKTKSEFVMVTEDVAVKLKGVFFRLDGEITRTDVLDRENAKVTVGGHLDQRVIAVIFDTCMQDTTKKFHFKLYGKPDESTKVMEQIANEMNKGLVKITKDDLAMPFQISNIRLENGGLEFDLSRIQTMWKEIKPSKVKR